MLPPVQVRGVSRRPPVHWERGQLVSGRGKSQIWVTLGPKSTHSPWSPPPALAPASAAPGGVWSNGTFSEVARAASRGQCLRCSEMWGRERPQHWVGQTVA